MKKSLTAPAALTALCALGPFACAAHAQSYNSGTSNVTLYGILDAGITYVSNEAPAFRSATGNRNFKFSSGNLQGSRWGLKGAEDLGGGLKAVFVLEAGFDLGTGASGQNGRMFGRQAYVGLSSASAGTVTLGRQYDLVVDFVGPLASGSQWATFSGAHVFDNDNLNNSFRINNSVKYTTANYNGFSAGALYGFSNQANTGGGSGFANNRAWSAGLGYANGPITLGAGYLYLGSPSAALPANTGGAVSGDYGSFPATGGANPPVAVIDRQQVWAAGGAYAFGPATIGLVYSYSKFDYLRNAGSWKFNNIEVNAKYMLTPTLQLGAAYIYTWSTVQLVSRTGRTTNESPKYHQVNLGLDYWLSKRTDAYLVVLFQDADEAQLNGQPFSSTSRQIAVTTGIRHKF